MSSFFYEILVIVIPRNARTFNGTRIDTLVQYWKAVLVWLYFFVLVCSIHFRTSFLACYLIYDPAVFLPSIIPTLLIESVYQYARAWLNPNSFEFHTLWAVNHFSLLRLGVRFRLGLPKIYFTRVFFKKYYSQMILVQKMTFETFIMNNSELSTMCTNLN